MSSLPMRVHLHVTCASTNPLFCEGSQVLQETHAMGDKQGFGFVHNIIHAEHLS